MTPPQPQLLTLLGVPALRGCLLIQSRLAPAWLFFRTWNETCSPVCTYLRAAAHQQQMFSSHLDASCSRLGGHGWSGATKSNCPKYRCRESNVDTWMHFVAARSKSPAFTHAINQRRHKGVRLVSFPPHIEGLVGGCFFCTLPVRHVISALHVSVMDQSSTLQVSLLFAHSDTVDGLWQMEIYCQASSLLAAPL